MREGRRLARFQDENVPGVTLPRSTPCTTPVSARTSGILLTVIDAIVRGVIVLDPVSSSVDA